MDDRRQYDGGAIGRAPSPEEVHEKLRRETDAAGQKLGLNQAQSGQAMREQNISEFIEQEIWSRRSEIRTLELLRESMSVSLLSHGASGLASLLRRK